MLKTSGLILVFALAATMAAPNVRAEGSPKGGLTFAVTVEMNSVGLKFKTPSGADPKPFPMLDIHTVTDGQTTVEQFDPREIWFQNQQLGRWQDGASNTLVMAAVLQALPEGFKHRFVTREEYDRAAASSNADWNPASLTRWIADFANDTAALQPTPQRTDAVLKSVLEFQFQNDPNRLAFAFCFLPNVYGIKPSQWFVALFQLAPDVSRQKALTAIRQQFLKSVAPTRPAATRAAETAAAAPLPGATPPGTNCSPEFVASLEQVIRTTRNMKGWWYVTTENYIIVSNLGSKNSPLVKRLQENIEYLRTGFQTFMPPRHPIDAVSVIRVFATSEEYKAYVPSDSQWSHGIWMPSTKELVIEPMEQVGTRNQREDVLSTAYHEAFHQYFYYAFDQAPASMWFSEGFACFFEAAHVTEKSLRIEKSAWRVPEILDAIASNKVDLANLVQMSRDQFYQSHSNDKAARGRNYALAYGLIYYLAKGAPRNKQNPYAGIIPRYCDALWSTRNPDQATAAAFEGIDWADLQSDFVAYWKSHAGAN